MSHVKTPFVGQNDALEYFVWKLHKEAFHELHQHYLHFITYFPLFETSFTVV